MWTHGSAGGGGRRGPGCRSNVDDRRPLQHKSELISSAHDFNADLETYGLLTHLVSNFFSSEEGDAGQYLKEYPAIHPLEAVIHERKARGDVVGRGWAWSSGPTPKPKSEIQVLAAEVLS